MFHISYDGLFSEVAVYTCDPCLARLIEYITATTYTYKHLHICSTCSVHANTGKMPVLPNWDISNWMHKEWNDVQCSQYRTQFYCTYVYAPKFCCQILDLSDDHPLFAGMNIEVEVAMDIFRYCEVCQRQFWLDGSNTWDWWPIVWSKIGKQTSKVLEQKWT